MKTSREFFQGMGTCVGSLLSRNNLFASLVLSIFMATGFSFAADVAPFYFDGISDDKQQESWEFLMKYKMWGSDGIYLTNEGEIRLEEISGYVGTSTGDMTIGPNHHIGGPILIGGNFNVYTGVKDVELLGGPFRTLGDVVFPAWQADFMPSTRFDGPYCVQGNLTGTGGEYDPTFTEWEKKITGGLFNGEDYSSCPASVPEVDTSLFVPSVAGWETAVWEEGINAGPSNQVHYIHVPPDSVYENEYGTYDKYIENIKVSATPQFKLYIVMPPGGRLTRIFVRDGLNIDNSSHNPIIQVIYVEDGHTFNRATNSWDMSNTDNFTYIENQNYAGNLLFFTDKKIDWGSTDNPEYQGTFITTDTLYIGNDFTVAGQLVAKYVRIRAPFTGDFRYVPFDPPILNIDPTALASGKFLETEENQYVPIKLDAVPLTAVHFSYCFEAPDSTAEGIASYADFDAAKAGMSICGMDTGLVVIPVGKIYPTDSVFVNAVKDGVIESDEKFKLHVFDMGGAVLPGNKRSGSFTLYIKDGDENVPPVLKDTTLSILENSVVHTVAGTLNATDSNRDPLTYQIIEGDSSVFRVDSTGKVVLKQAVLDYETKTSYSIKVVVSDGLLMDTATVKINVVDVNEKPEVADTSYTVEENSVVGLLLGTLTSTDPDKSSPNNTHTFEILSGNGDGMFALSTAGKLTVAKSPDYEKTTSYTLKVVVSDAGTPSLSDTATVKITVTDVNEKPEVADASYTVEENSAVGLLLGTLTSTDPDKSAPNNTHTFKILSGNDDGMFALSTAGKLTVAKNGLNYEKTTSYTLKVVVSDAGTPSLSDTATVKINVVDVNEKPEVADTSYTVEENSVVGLLLGTLTSTDPDKSSPNNTHTFKILSGNGDGMFALSTEGKLTVAKSPDYEKTTSYTLKVVVSDAGTSSLSDTATVKITVTDVNEKPEVADASYTVEENSAVGLLLGTLTSTDPDKSSPNNTHTFEILSGNGDGMFALSTEGKLTVAKSLDYENTSSYTLKVVVSDAGTPSLSDTATVKITVTDVNEKPEVADTSYTVEENSVVGLLLGTLTSTDPDKSSPNNTHTFKILSGNGDGMFALSTAGKLTVAKSPDYEKTTSYTLKVVVSDAGTSSLSDTATVKITVTDVNEKPEIADAEFTIPRSSTAADLVGVLKASDVDAMDKDALTYKVITSSVPFEQSSSTANLVVKGTKPFVNVAKNIYELYVVVTDKGGLKDTAKVIVNVKNTPPVIETEEVFIAENSRDSAKVEVSDADGDTKFNYSITDTNNKFVINSSTGVISLKKDITLNHESADSILYVLVTVSDGVSATSKKIAVKVTDVNERPNVEDQIYSVSETAKAKTVVGKVTATDPDMDKLTFKILSGDSDWFDLNSSNANITLKKSGLDYETKKTYSIKVMVSDGKLSDTAKVTIEVLNVIEKSVVNVTTVESGSTRFEIIKDTAFINRTFADISWVLTDKNGKNSYRDTSLMNLTDGCRTYRFADTDKTIDVRGKDSVTICVSTSVPEVVIKPVTRDSSKITGVTIVEQANTVDSSYYVKDKENELVAIVKDPLTSSIDTIPLEVRLESVSVPEKLIENAVEIQEDFYPEPPADSALHKYVENGMIAVEYTQKVNGNTVVVKYYETESGERITDSEGREIVYVTYAAILNGDTVKISYPADALTGKPVEVTVGNSSLASGNNSSGESGSNGSSNNSGSSSNNSSSNSGNSSNGSSNNSGSSSNNPGNSSNGSSSGSSNGSGSSSENSGSEIAGGSNSFTGGVFEISYVYTDKNGNVVEISYPVDSKGTILKNEVGDKSYTVTYSYVNDYGNSATHSVDIILDDIRPVVKILTPEHLSKHSSVSVEVIWTVDGIEQDTLNLQSLDVGTNKIIRTFRDKAGNEASDTVVITMKNAKNVVISMVEPLVKIDPEKAEELYAENPPKEDERFMVSILNPREEKEEIVAQGNSSNVEKGEGGEPYPGYPGAHLGPTMKIELKMPSVNAFGGLATIDDMIESDGLVSLEAGGGWDRKKVTVDEYINEYCSEEFQEEVDRSNLAATPLYTVKYKMHVWIYTSLGQFVDDYSFSLDLEDGNLVNDAGVLELFFELKPDADGALRASTGRLLGTGAYLFKTEISSVAKLRCQLPDKKVGSRIVEKEDDLTTFGYSRPSNP